MAIKPVTIAEPNMQHVLMILCKLRFENPVKPCPDVHPFASLAPNKSRLPPMKPLKGSVPGTRLLLLNCPLKYEEVIAPGIAPNIIYKNW